MGEAVSIQDRHLYSLTQLASLYSISRDTVKRRLEKSGVPSSSERRGSPVFHIALASRAIIEGEMPGGTGIGDDPDEMPPKERLDWYKSESEKTKVLESKGELIRLADHTNALSSLVKILIVPLDTLVDNLERQRVPVDALEKIERAIRKIKTKLAGRLELFEAGGR